ncbi:MAG: creatininase family protein [Flavobacteriaceae bacterium]
MDTTIHWGNYERMRPSQIEAIIDQVPIAYLPWGALEFHGAHNPVGLDGIKAHHLCMDLAKEVGGVVLPPVYLAANLIKSYPGVHFPKHSLEFTEGLIKSMAIQYVDQLAEQHIKIIVLLSGHAGEPHLQTLRDVATIFNQRYPSNHCWALAEFDMVPDTLLKANHSALGETSLQLYYAPETVALENLPNHRDITLQLDAISGEDPRQATTTHGKKIAQAFLSNATTRLNELLTKYHGI